MDPHTDSARHSRRSDLSPPDSSQLSPAASSSSPRHPLFKAAIILTGLASFIFLASVFQPHPSSADPLHNPDPDAASSRNPAALDDAARSQLMRSLTAQPHPQGWRVLGALASSRYLVMIHAAPLAPRYSVYSLQGRLLEPDLHADEVYRSFPDLDIPALRLEPAADPANQPLMLADPPSIDHGSDR